jgi:hypothetical protein
MAHASIKTYGGRSDNQMQPSRVAFERSQHP